MTVANSHQAQDLSYLEQYFSYYSRRNRAAYTMRIILTIIGALVVGRASAFGVLPTKGASSQKTLQSPLNASKGPGNIQRPANEFSRTYQTERVLGSKQRDYQTTIEATGEELAGLAERFDLADISMLQADLVMRREPGIKGTANRVAGVQVEGSVVAKVTQTCVRTNENFDVDLEFPLFAVVRPVAGLSDDDDDLSELEGFFEEERRSRSKKGKSRKDKGVTTPERNVNEMDVAELQRMLQDFDLEDDVIEDEAIFSVNGTIDLGELVSQLFWLKLDPYPKKPGTYPIRTSITG